MRSFDDFIVLNYIGEMSLAADWYYCPNCGYKWVVQGDHYCSNCGVSLSWEKFESES